jgi:predicted nucleotidyltransferase
MALDNETLNKIVNDYVDEVRQAMPIDKVYLYGSYAKGTATEHSDIDLCFFSHSFEGQKLVDVVTQLLMLAEKWRKIDIEPYAMPTSELNNDNPFVNEILRTGKEVILPAQV